MKFLIPAITSLAFFGLAKGAPAAVHAALANRGNGHGQGGPNPNSHHNQCAVSTQYPTLEPYLTGNCQWAASTNRHNSTFLPELAKAQHPKLLWIGCGDSREPESVILGQQPGAVFTHRNIGNQFLPTDDSANAVLDYGVLHVQVEHVAVVGHTSCGGANAAYGIAHDDGHGEEEHLGAQLSRFLEPLVELAKTMPNGSTVEDLIVANVKKGVADVVASPTIQAAWQSGQQVYVHGWLYNLTSGLITDLDVSRGPLSQ